MICAFWLARLWIQANERALTNPQLRYVDQQDVFKKIYLTKDVVVKFTPYSHYVLYRDLIKKSNGKKELYLHELK